MINNVEICTPYICINKSCVYIFNFLKEYRKESRKMFSKHDCHFNTL